VHGEDLLVDDSRDGQAVEAVRECLPQLDVVSPLALIVEAVNTVDGRTLVVAAENEEVLGILDLVREEQADCLKTLLAAVHVIAEEEVVGFWWEPAVLEEAKEIVILPVDVAADLGIMSAWSVVSFAWVETCLDWSLELQQDGLTDEDLT